MWETSVKSVNSKSASRRIVRVSITGLFDMFDYDIPFNSQERITIIHGLNGYGKTTLLKIIDGIFNSRYVDIIQIPFHSFVVYFNDGNKLTLSKEIKLHKLKNREVGRLRLNIDYYRANIDTEEKYQYPDRFEDRSMIESRIEYERALLLHNANSNNSIDDEFIERYLESTSTRREQNAPEWLIELRDSLKVQFIQSQRLLLIPPQEDGVSYRQKTHMTLAVTTYTKELARFIQLKLGEYAATSQSLDRTFPVRLVSQEETIPLTTTEIRQMLNDLEQRRSRLINAGLLEKDTEQGFQIFDEINEQQKNILSVYIRDVNQKLDVLNEIAARIDLFKQIINDHFNHKYIVVNKNKGFAFFTSNDKPLSPEDLSTGEQHQLILAYESLFKVDPNSLILIDEPEISLHVAWQMRFLEDLQNIISLSKFDVLIATHSPQIINDKWDLTVRLGVETP